MATVFSEEFGIYQELNSKLLKTWKIYVDKIWHNNSVQWMLFVRSQLVRLAVLDSQIQRNSSLSELLCIPVFELLKASIDPYRYFKKLPQAS